MGHFAVEFARLRCSQGRVGVSRKWEASTRTILGSKLGRPDGPITVDPDTRTQYARDAITCCECVRLITPLGQVVIHIKITPTNARAICRELTR